MANRLQPPPPVSEAFAHGVRLLDRNELAEAAAAFAEAVRLAPSHAAARGNLGVVLARLGRHEDAVGCFQAAAVLQPFSAAAQANLGQNLFQLRRHEEAAASFRRAADLAPRDPVHLLRLAHVLSHVAPLPDVIAAYRAALLLPDAEPPLGADDRATALNNLGNSLRATGDAQEAARCFEQAIALRAEATMLCNLGKALLETRDLARAEQSFRTALALGSTLPDAPSGLAVALLAQGQLPEGFALFEQRWHMPQMRNSQRGFAQPQWRGEAAAGRTLLIHAEQGQGDTLQFCRYAVLAARRGWRVILEVQPSLVRLLRALPEVEQVIARGDTLPPFDSHCPMLSLPLAFGTTLDSIPGESFLRAAPAPPRFGALRVGLSWAGNAYADQPDLAAVAARRAIDPALLAPLLDLPGLRFTSLQKNETGWQDPRLHDPMGAVQDFADTAAIVAGLDLVIAVDSAVAHLAAALGRPVWLLDRFDACWRWLDNRSDSPWYPTMRIFRQRSPGDWVGVIDDVATALQAKKR